MDFKNLRRMVTGDVKDVDAKKVIRRTRGLKNPYERKISDKEKEIQKRLDKANEEGGLYGDRQAARDVEEANKALEELRKRKKR